MSLRPVTVFAVCLLAAAAAADRPPNVVLILADDLGYGDPQCYNADSKIPTPHIDRLAREGTRFTDAHSPASVCVPTRYSLLTGRYSFRRPNRNGSYDAGPLIDDDVSTFPAMLRAAGYRTSMVGKWHLGFEFTNFEQPLAGGPIDRGFDRFFGVPASTDIPPYFFIDGSRAAPPPTETIDEHHSPGVSKIQGAFWRSGKIAPGLKLDDVLPTFEAKAITELDAFATTPERPFFLYLALTAPHTPWLPSPAARGRSAMKGDGVSDALTDYGDFVTQVDDVVGRVVTKLESLGMTEDTLVLFTSDNGPTWYEEDVRKTGHDSAGPWRGMKGDVWEAGHRVPFIVRWPGRVPSGRTCDELIGQVDLMATLAALTSQTLPQEAAPDSVNLLPLILGERDAKGRATLITQSSAGVLALRKGAWKFIPHLGSGGFSPPKNEKPDRGGPRVQLYDLDRDPGESKNLAAEGPEVVTELSALLDRLRGAKRTAP